MDFEIEINEQSDWDVLPQQRPPDLARVGLLHGRAPLATQATVIMAPEALQLVDAHLLSDIGKELGGFLLGTSYQHSGRLYVDVSAAIIAHSDKNGPVHFTFTADSWAMAHREREALYPELSIVGWFHSHPDLGVFYSADDVVVHTTAFSSLWHVGLVVDPVRREACVFGWELAADGRPEDIIPLNGFVERATTHNGQSLIDWNWAHGTGLASLQRRAYTDGMRRAVGMQTNTAPSGKPVDMVGAMMRVSGLTFLLASLLFLMVLWPTWARTSALETAVYSLGESQRAALHEQGLISCPSNQINILSPLPNMTIPRDGEISIVGTAVDPNARYYQVAVRQIEQEPFTNEWSVIDWRRRDTTGDVIGTWDLSDYGPGRYEIRVSSMRANDSRMTTTACIVPVIKPARGEPSMTGPVSALPIDENVSVAYVPAWAIVDEH